MINYKLVFDDVSIGTLYNSDLITAPAYKYSVNTGDDFCLGNATSAEVSFATKALDSSCIGKEFVLYRKEDAGSFEEVNKFVIKEANKDINNVYTVNAYDLLTRFDKDVSSWLAAVAFPTTIRSFLTQLATECNVSYGNLPSFPNESLSVPAFTGTCTGRQLLKYISQACGRYFYYSNTYGLMLGNYTANATVLTSSSYKYKDLADYVTPEIQGVWIGKEDGDVGGSYVIAGGTNIYKIYNNPFLCNATDYVTAASNILSEIRFISSYRPGTIEVNRLGTINVGSIITVDSGSFTVMSIDASSTGITLSSVGKAERSAALTSNEEKIISQGKSNVLKRTVDATVSTVANINTRLGTAETTIASHSSTISQQADKIALVVEESQGQNVIKSASIVAAINDSGSEVVINADHVELNANAVTFTDLSTSGSTSINGDNITTGTVNTGRLNTSEIISAQSGSIKTIAAEDLTLQILNKRVSTISVSEESDYPFALSEDGWYESTNSGVDESYSLCKVSFTTTQPDSNITFNVYNGGELYFDFGFIGKLDEPLVRSYVRSEETNYGYSFMNDGNTYTKESPKVYSVNIPTAGSHYIEFKFIRDGGIQVLPDKLGFKLYTQPTSTLTLNQNGIYVTGTELNINGVVKFTDLANEGSSVINGGNITTGSLSANRISGGTLSGSELYLGDGSFSVDSSGKLTCTGAEITGNSVSAVSGTNQSYMSPTMIYSPVLRATTALKLNNYTIYSRANSVITTTYYLMAIPALDVSNHTCTITLNCYSDASHTTLVNAPIAFTEASKINFYNSITRQKVSTKSWSVTIPSGSSSASTTVSVPTTAGYWSWDSYVYTFTEVYTSTIANSGMVPDCNVIPYKDNSYDLGSSTLRWHDIYATNPTIQTSDRNQKKDIETIDDRYNYLFDNLQPVKYKFIDGHRTHLGLVAQDVEEAMNNANIDSEDFACLIKSTDEQGQEHYGLRYGELIALLIKEVQDLKAEVKSLRGGQS